MLEAVVRFTRKVLWFSVKCVLETVVSTLSFVLTH